MKEVNKNKSIKQLANAKIQFNINEVEVENLKWFNKALKSKL